MHWLGIRDVLTLGGIIPPIPPGEEERLEEVLARGIRLHHITRQMDEGRDVTPGPDIIGAAEAYQRFLGEVHPQWSGIELHLSNEVLKLRGRIDRRGLVFGEPALVDLCGKHEAAWHGPRLWGYWWLGGCNPHERRFALYLKDGTYKLKPFTDHAGDMATFFEAVRRARFSDAVESGPPTGDDDDDRE